MLLKNLQTDLINSNSFIGFLIRGHQLCYTLYSNLYLDHWKDASPGPVYWINPKVTRHGLGGARTHSMLTRQQSQS